MTAKTLADSIELGQAHESRVELNRMLDAIKRDAPQYFQMGGMRAKLVLSNGAKVTVSIMMPDESKKRRGARKAGA